MARRWTRWRACSCAGDAARTQLPPYDRAVLLREMQLLPDWFCARHLRLEPDAADAQLLAETFEFLVREALAQPRGVRASRLSLAQPDDHRRARSLASSISRMRCAGPIGYDLVSLLKDCYVAWPRARVEAWVEAYRERLLAGGRIAGGRRTRREFLRWFDLIGLQRHIKVLGIFARLCYRDGKTGYLADLPRTLDYVRDTAARYPRAARVRRLGRSAAGARAGRRQRARAGAVRAHEGHDAGGRARRAHAAADRCHAQAAAAGARPGR